MNANRSRPGGAVKRMLACFLVFVAATAAGADAPQSLAPPEVVDAFHRALATGSRARALELLDPEVVIFENGGVEASRDEYESQHLSADMSFAARTLREVLSRRSRIVDDIAWVFSESRKTSAVPGRTLHVLGKETVLLRRTEAGWRIVHVHWSSRSGRRRP